MAASGFAGLGYQIAWTQQFTLWLGHEAAAVLAVVGAFFGGLAVGAFALGARVAASPRPARWYAACELCIGVWSLLLVAAMPAFSVGVLRVTGAQPSPGLQWSVAFAGTFLLLSPATVAMGATLPAMERVAARRAEGGGSIAALYGANTFGGVLGVVAGAFWLIPRIGLARTTGVSVALNLLCAASALILFPSAPGRAPADTPPTTAGEPDGAKVALARLALTGLLGIAYEVLVVRVLGQVTEQTVYTFALLLAVYLGGSAAGAAGYHRWLARRPAGDRLTDALLGALAIACLAGTASLWAADRERQAAARALGGGLGAALGAEAALAVVAFAPATLVMGAVFSHLSDRARAAGIAFGRALGVNTAAAALAPLLAGVVAAPAFGPKLALLLSCLGYLALVSRRAWRRPLILAPAAVVVALAALAPPLAFVDVPSGGRVVYYREGVMAAVSVVEDADGVARLRIDNRQQEGSNATFRVDARQAWLPLLLHAAPVRALFLGLGTGVTAASAADDPTLAVDAVELLPEVIAASDAFLHDHVRPHIIAADARRFVRAAGPGYDVIVSDNFHPARSGSGALHTVEHFAAVRARLNAGGLYCQWLPLHQLDLGTLRSIVRSFLTAFPDAAALLASNSLETPVVGLIGRAPAAVLDMTALRKRIARVALPDRLVALGLEDDLAVLGGFIAGSTGLGRFAGDAPLNTDDRPIVAYGAPRVTYAPDDLPRDRLLALLRQVSIEPAELLSPAPDRASAARLAAYWAARDRFIEAGRDVHPSASPAEMLAQVRDPLLAVLRLSPDFRPAYDPLLTMATALARSDVSGARALLTELARLQPARTEASRALALMDARARAPAPAAP